MPSIFNVLEGSWGRSVLYKEKTKRVASKNNLNEVEPDPRLRITVNPFESSDDEEKEDSSGEDARSIDDTLLPHFLSSILGTILEDTVTQMRILAASSNEIKIIKVKSDWDVLLRKKYSVKEVEHVDELERIDRNKLGCIEYKINKLESDRVYLIEVIKGTYVDLSVKKSFKSLNDSVNTIVALKKYRLDLIEEEAKNRLIRRDLIRQLRLMRNHIKSALYDTDIRIDELTAHVEDAGLVSESRSRYIENWQRARTEQHDQTINDTELSYSDSVEFYKRRTDIEHRVHMEVEILTHIVINETLQKVEDKMTEYDKDMEAIDLKIQIQKNDFQDMVEKRLELQKIIELHDKEMSDWVYFKDEREKKRLYHEKMTNAAIAVQAWWRGLLVRRQLGPYKPPKKRGGAAAAAGKKKK